MLQSIMDGEFTLRSVVDEEFMAWARMIGETYGADRTEEELANQRAATDLKRTVAAFDGDMPVAGASVYRRLLTVPGAVVPVAGIASVAVTPTHRRRGLLTAMMRKILTQQYEKHGEPLAALRPSEAGIYGRYGFGPATRGSLMRCARRSMRFRPGVDFGTGRVRLLARDVAQPLIEQIYDSVRFASVGWPDRNDSHWTVRLFDSPGATTHLRYAVHFDSDRRPTAYALFRYRAAADAVGDDAGTIEVVELAAASSSTYAALWRFLAGIDLKPWIEYEGAVDEALPHLLLDPRCVRMTLVDRLWVRLVDVGRALAARRYSSPMDVVLEVADEFCPWNSGRYRLQAGGGDVECKPTTAQPHLRLAVADLGAAFLGGTTLSALSAAGVIQELKTGAAAQASRAFRADREPSYPGGWAFPLY